MWDLWWTNRHWDRIFPEYFGFPLSISFHRCSITRKNETLIIFITGLHSKPQGWGASVASAAVPFSTKEKPNYNAVNTVNLTIKVSYCRVCTAFII
jgi:hypothetical protein